MDFPAARLANRPRIESMASSPSFPGPGPGFSSGSSGDQNDGSGVWTVVEPCGQAGLCPFVCWGGAVLLAPPSALPALAPGGGCSYGDAVRITPLAQQSPATRPVLIARLYNVLPDPPSRPHACRCSGVGSYTVVLPRRILVALPSSSEAGGTGGTAAELVLPATFEARIEVVSSSSNGTARRTSLGSPTASSGSTQPPNKSAIPTASSIGLVPILPGDTPTQPPLRLTVVRPFLLHAAVATGALVVVHCPWIGRFNKPSAYKVAHCLPSSNVGQSLRLVVPRHTRLALLPPAPPVSEGGRGAAEAATDRAAADGALPFQRPSSFLAAAVTALADGLLELLDAMGDDDGYSPQGWDPQEACGIRALALLVPRAVLLSGPPGVGKTHAVREAARRALSEKGLRVHVQVINGGELAAEGNSTDVVGAVREAFLVANGATFVGGGYDASLLFFDEMDALCPAADAGASGAAAATRLVTQLGLLLDDATSPERNRRYDPRILIVGATNRPHGIHPALRRPGRLDKEIVVPPPDADTRLAILRSLLLRPHPPSTRSPSPGADTTGAAPPPTDARGMEMDAWLPGVARDCVGYVAADLQALVREAIVATASAQQEQGGEDGGGGGSVSITEAALRGAMERVGASVLRGKGLEVPHVPWSAIGGQEEAKRRLQQALEWPLRYPKTLARFFSPPRAGEDGDGGNRGGGPLSATGNGILLYGPPGCAKTTLVKAAVSAVRGVSFLSLSSGDVYSVYVGDAEAAVRNAFALARQAAPCVLFFDELDAIVGTSTSSSTGGAAPGGRGGGAEARVLSTFLNELDGVDAPVGGDGVLVVGATNLPDALDPALLRPGRLSHLIEVTPPRSLAERLAVLRIHTGKMPLRESGADDTDAVDLSALAGRLGGYSGADIEGLCREAAMAALREDADAVCGRHFAAALEAVPPSLPVDA